jgi:hypothetical protein
MFWWMGGASEFSSLGDGRKGLFAFPSLPGSLSWTEHGSCLLVAPRKSTVDCATAQGQPSAQVSSDLSPPWSGKNSRVETQEWAKEESCQVRSGPSPHIGCLGSKENAAKTASVYTCPCF